MILDGKEYKFNGKILKTIIIQEYGTISGFADHMGWRRETIYTYTGNTTEPPQDKTRKMARALNVSPMEFYKYSGDYVQDGVDAALLQWAYERQNKRVDRMKDNDVLQFIQVTREDTLEETEEEGGESPYFVQGPAASSDSAESERNGDV